MNAVKWKIQNEIQINSKLLKYVFMAMEKKKYRQIPKDAFTDSMCVHTIRYFYGYDDVLCFAKVCFVIIFFSI